MGRLTTHQTKEDKLAAKALVNQRARAKKAEEEHNLLSRHPDQTAVLSRGQARKRFLEEINANRVELVPLSIPTLPEVTGVDEESGDIESGTYYRIDKLIKENEDRPVEGQRADDDSFKNSNDGDSSGIIN
jgi:hypothetical protein